MKVEYQWNVNDIMQREPSTCSSRMIVYRGVKVFRICLRNDAKSPVLFVMVIGLNRIGFQVESICYGTKNGETATLQNMVLMKEEEIRDGNIKIFNRNLSKQVTGNTTFVFRIFLEGSVPTIPIVYRTDSPRINYGLLQKVKMGRTLKSA